MKVDANERRSGDVEEVGPFYWRVGRPITISFLILLILLAVLVLTGVISRWFSFIAPSLGVIRYLVYRYFGR